MSTVKLTASMLVAVFVFLGGAVLAQAQNNTSWVSGTGSDSNGCTRSAPCATFAFAITQTNAGGRITAADAGDFGSVTITKAITIDGGSEFAQIQLSAAGTAVTINAGFSDKVTLRRLRLDGKNGTGTTGIAFVAFTGVAQLNVENCVIRGFSSTGIDFRPSSGGFNKFALSVTDTNITGTATGIIMSMGAFDFFVGGTVNNCNIYDVSGDGIKVLLGALIVSNSTISGTINVTGNGINAASATAGNAAEIMVSNCLITRFSKGINAGGGAGPSTVDVGNSAINNNGTGFNAGANGTIRSFGNNSLAENSADGFSTTTKALQ